MIDYTSVLKTTHNCLLDYTYATLNVNRSATESYMTVTAHFVNNEYELKSYVLETRELDERHTAEHLAKELENCALEWGLNKPIVVSHNASNILKAVKILNWRSVPCLAHTIKLAAKTGLPVNFVSKLLAKSRDIVGYFKRNAYATSTLHKKQSLLQMKELNLIKMLIPGGTPRMICWSVCQVRRPPSMQHLQNLT